MRCTALDARHAQRQQRSCAHGERLQGGGALCCCPAPRTAQPQAHPKGNGCRGRGRGGGQARCTRYGELQPPQAASAGGAGSASRPAGRPQQQGHAAEQRSVSLRCSMTTHGWLRAVGLPPQRKRDAFPDAGRLTAGKNLANQARSRSILCEDPYAPPPAAARRQQQQIDCEAQQAALQGGAAAGLPLPLGATAPPAIAESNLQELAGRHCRGALMRLIRRPPGLRGPR
jgi:hypothetical protein